MKLSTRQHLMTYGYPGVDLHTATGEYRYPKGPEHYGLGQIRCEATGGITEHVRTSHERSWRGRRLNICEHCATESEVMASRSLLELNEARKP